MRDVAYWPKTFLDEIEQASIERGTRLWALGGPSFVYRTPDTTLWIDPYFYGTPDDAVPDAYRAVSIPINPDEVRLADLVFSTHDHVDHCHGGTLVPMVQNTGVTCIAPESSARKMREFGIPEDRIRQVQPGDVFAFRDVTIHVYPAYDANEQYAVTYILESNGTKLFVSGDTSDGPAIETVANEHKLDFALLAFGRTWYMNEEQLLQVAQKLRPKTLLPFHWEFWRNHTGSIKRLFELYFRQQPDFNIQILLIGDSIQLAE